MSCRPSGHSQPVCWSSTGGNVPPTPAKTSQPEQVSRGQQVEEQEAAGQNEVVRSVSPGQVAVPAVKPAVCLQSSPAHLSMSPPPQPSPSLWASAQAPLPRWTKVMPMALRAPSCPMMPCLSWPSPTPPRSSSGGRQRSKGRRRRRSFQMKMCSRVCVCVGLLAVGDPSEGRPGGGEGRWQ